jgi:hypothetical protein
VKRIALFGGQLPLMQSTVLNRRIFVFDVLAESR